MAEKKKAVSFLTIDLDDSPVVSKLRGLTKTFKRNATAWNQSFELVGKGVRALDATVGALARTFLDATREANKFARAAAEVQTIADQSEFPLAKIRDITFELTTLYGSDQTQNAKALYQTISAGATTAGQATEILHTASKLALGGVTDVTTGVDALTNVVNAYASTGAKATDVSDAFFVAIKAGKTNAEELAQGIGQVAPVASQLGVGFEDLLAATAALTTNGVATSEAFTQIRSALVGIVKGQDKSKAVAAAKELGIEFSAAALKTKGFVGFLKDLADSKPTEAQLLKLFGRVEGVQAVMGLAANNGQKFNEILDAMAGKAGATDAAFSTMTQTLDFQVTKFNSLSQASQVALGNLTADSKTAYRSMSAINDALVSIIEWFDSPSGRASMESFFQAIATTVSVLLTSMAGLLKALNAIRKEYALLKGEAFVEALDGGLAARLDVLADRLYEIGEGRSGGVRGGPSSQSGALPRLGPNAPGGRGRRGGASGPSGGKGKPGKVGSDERFDYLGQFFSDLVNDSQYDLVRLMIQEGEALNERKAREAEDQFRNGIRPGEGGPVAALKNEFQDLITTANEFDVTWGGVMSGLGQGASMIGGTLTNALQGFSSIMGQYITDLILGVDTLKKSLGEAVGDMLVALGTQLIQTGIAALALGALSFIPGLQAFTGPPGAGLVAGGIAIAAGAGIVAVGKAMGGGAAPGRGGAPSASGGTGRGRGAPVADPATADILYRRDRDKSHVTQEIHFHGFVGSERRLAREFRRISGDDSLRPGS